MCPSGDYSSRFSQHYLLDPVTHEIVPCSMEEWARSYEDFSLRRVASTHLSPHVHVSTVFLGLDHGWSDDGPPVLFESMIFDPHEVFGEDQRMERYCTWDEAVAGHERMVAELISMGADSLTMNTLQATYDEIEAEKKVAPPSD